MPNWVIFVIIGALVVIVIIASRPLWRRDSHYVSPATADQEKAIRFLVIEVAPKLREKPLRYRDIQRLLKGNTAFDQEMYLRFKDLHSKGNLSVDSMYKAMGLTTA